MPSGLTDAGTAGGTNAIYERCNPKLLAMGYGFTARVTTHIYAMLFGRANPARAVDVPRGARKRSTETPRSPSKHAGTGSHDASEPLQAAAPTTAIAKAIAPSLPERDTATEQPLCATRIAACKYLQ